ncbi:MAG: glycosyltransferase family 2 protein [Desulfovibrio sp.]|nr:glycosyltransferase family 2 protein [Desulfovibrio sp.]
MLISVIIPCRNGENYLSEAVAGIRRQKLPVEIIVVDDGSTDKTACLAESAGCRVMRHEARRGQVAGKNTGIRAANGNYVMFHDHDDMMNAGALSTLYNKLVAGEDLWLVMAKVRDFLSPELSKIRKQDIAATIKKEPYYGLFTGAVLMRKALFDRVGFFDENLNTGEIISLLTKMDKIHLQYKKIDFVACNRRIHMTNYGRTDTAKEYKDYSAVLRAGLFSEMRGSK